MSELVKATAPSLDSREYMDLVKNTVVAKDVSEHEFSLFLHQCRRTGLDPLCRQIYCISRKTKDGGRRITIQTSIDGFRLIAERSGKYAGQIGPHWCGPDGQWSDVWLQREAPTAARVGVIRSDFKEPLYGVALLKSYNPGFNDLWNKMPEVMLAKCAEASALRKAFPQELSGLYSSDEMVDQAEEPRRSQEAADAVAERKLAEAKERKSAPKPAEPAVSTPEVISPAVVELWKRMTDIKGVCEAFAEMKKSFVELMGNDSKYYEILKKHGFAHSNDVKQKGAVAARNCGKELLEALIAGEPVEFAAGEDDVPSVDELKAGTTKEAQRQTLGAHLSPKAREISEQLVKEMEQ